MGTNIRFKNILFLYKYYKMVQEKDQGVQATVIRCFGNEPATKKGIAEIVKNIDPKDINLEINSYPTNQINTADKEVCKIYEDKLTCSELGLDYVHIPGQEYNSVMLYILRQNKQTESKK